MSASPGRRVRRLWLRITWIDSDWDDAGLGWSELEFIRQNPSHPFDRSINLLGAESPRTAVGGVASCVSAAPDRRVGRLWLRVTWIDSDCDDAVLECSELEFIRQNPSHPFDRSFNLLGAESPRTAVADVASCTSPRPRGD